MLGDLIGQLWSVRFGAGVVVGMVLQRTWCFVRARWLDHKRPLPGGGHRHVPGFSKVWVVGAMVTLVMGYYIVETQRIDNCQAQFGDAVAARSAITAENDNLSRQERSAFANWLRDLLNPPPEIAAQSPDDPDRQLWGLQRSQFWYGQIASLEAQQEANDRERANNPIPDPTCGRGSH